MPTSIQYKESCRKGIYSYDTYYNKTNYEPAYRVEYVEGMVIAVIIADIRENFYDQLKQYMKK